MDRIAVEGLRVEAIVGALTYERRRRQVLVVDVEVDADLTPAARTDDLADALDYRRMAEIVRQLARDGRFRLIETLAVRAAEALLEQLPVTRARVVVRKPPAIPDADCATIVVERRC